MLKKAIIVAAVWAWPLAGAAAASIYNYDGSWVYHLYYSGWYSAERMGGDEAGLAIIIFGFDINENGLRGLDCLKLDQDGNETGRDTVWRWPNVYSMCVLGVLNRPLGCITTFYFQDESYSHYSSVLATPWGNLVEEGEDRFKCLAQPRSESYYYCYRYYGGEYQMCKMVGLTVVAAFKPAASIGCMACDDTGVVYTSGANTITAYRDTGSIIRSWNSEVPNWDLTLDEQSRLLAEGEDGYTYIYSTTGSLWGRFKKRYGAYDDATTGPGGKYYVRVEHYFNPWAVTVYRFAPSMTNIRPASLGRIKAMFQ